jgi:hypothetical protein
MFAAFALENPPFYLLSMVTLARSGSSPWVSQNDICREVTKYRKLKGEQIRWANLRSISAQERRELLSFPEELLDFAALT